MSLSKQASALSWDVMELGRKAGSGDLDSLAERITQFSADLGTIAGIKQDPMSLSSLEARLGTTVFRFISDERLESVKDLAAKSKRALLEDLPVLNEYKKGDGGSLGSLQRNLTQIAHALRSSGL